MKRNKTLAILAIMLIIAGQTWALSFTQLNSLINGSVEATITLTDDFTCCDGDEVYEDGIVIARDVTIIGKGHVIDGGSTIRIFHVTEGATLTIKDAILTKGNASKGGAVFVDANAILNIDSVDFINNIAVYRGGAIYSEGTVNVDHALFEENDISYRLANDDNGGAAIYNLNGILNILHSRIINNIKNYVARNGSDGDLFNGTVSTSGETLIADSYFANNPGSWGGAIAAMGYLNDVPFTLTVKKTTFEGHNATYGGAIYAESTVLVVDSCTFNNNSCVGAGSSKSQGGAISAYGANSKATITNSTFTNNSAATGGAIGFGGIYDDSLIDNCTFTDNKATSEGGAAYIYTNNDAVVTVSGSKFENNISSFGNAISNDGTLVLSKNTVSSTNADIANYYGVVTSEINIVILDNKTVDFVDEVLITAKVTDDNNNMISDINFDYEISGINATGYETETIDAQFNPNTGLYQASYSNSTIGEYLVSMTYSATDNLVIKKAILRRALSLVDDKDNSEDINKYYSEDIAAVRLTDRTLYKDGYWNTICLPFNVDLTDSISPLYGATVHQLSGAEVTNNGKTLCLTFADAGNTLTAGTPYLIKWSSSSNISEPTFSGRTITSTTPGSVSFNTNGYTVEFLGTYSPATLVANTADNLFMGSNNKLHYPTQDGYEVNAFRAYFKINSASAGAKAFTNFVIDFGDGDIEESATGIKTTDFTDSSTGAWFGIDGRPLNGKPTAKGIYIHNGRKVVLP